MNFLQNKYQIKIFKYTLCLPPKISPSAYFELKKDRFSGKKKSKSKCLFESFVYKIGYFNNNIIIAMYNMTLRIYI